MQTTSNEQLRTFKIWRGNSKGGDIVEYRIDHDEGMVVLDYSTHTILFPNPCLIF